MTKLSLKNYIDSIHDGLLPCGNGYVGQNRPYEILDLELEISAVIEQDDDGNIEIYVIDTENPADLSTVQKIKMKIRPLEKSPSQAKQRFPGRQVRPSLVSVP